MKRTHLPNSLIFTLVLMLVLSGAADARRWNANPTDLAMEYTQIIDQRSQNEIVVLMWFAPEMVEDSAENKTMQAILREYTVIAAVQTVISPLGKFTFSNTEEVILLTGDNRELKSIPEDDRPPVVAGAVNIMGSIMAQGLGAMGEGMTWYVFADSGVDSCGGGEFWILFAGEKYDYQTPIPGCR